MNIVEQIVGRIRGSSVSTHRHTTLVRGSLLSVRTVFSARNDDLARPIGSYSVTYMGVTVESSDLRYAVGILLDRAFLENCGYILETLPQPTTAASGHYVSEHCECWQVPQRSEMPSEEMIEWLNKCRDDWSGDEEGININETVASPGDWVCCAMGHYFVVDQKTFSECMEVSA